MSEKSGNIRVNRVVHLPGVIIEKVDDSGDTQIEAVPGVNIASLEGDDGSRLTVGLPAELHDVIGEMLKKEGIQTNE